MTEHLVTFQRNRADGRWRAVCTCFWVRHGTREEVQAAAASHDLDDWQPADPAQPEPAVTP